MRQIKILAITWLVLACVPVSASAAAVLFVHICQGTICEDFGPSPGPGPFVNNNITVGDFFISGSVSSLESSTLSNAATTTIQVQRLSETFDAEGDNLDIWLSATNYEAPDITNGYTFNTTMSATSSGAPTSVPMEFQGWLSFDNTVTFPPAGVTPGPINCLLPVGTGACNAGTASLVDSFGSVPFSMTTRTTFTIDTASSTATYTSNAQANIQAVSEIPEPGTILLMGTGLLYVARRFRKNKE